MDCVDCEFVDGGEGGRFFAHGSEDASDNAGKRWADIGCAGEQGLMNWARLFCVACVMDWPSTASPAPTSTESGCRVCTESRARAIRAVLAGSSRSPCLGQGAKVLWFGIVSMISQIKSKPCGGEREGGLVVEIEVEGEGVAGADARVRVMRSLVQSIK